MGSTAAYPERLGLDGLHLPQLKVAGRAESDCPVVQDRSDQSSVEHEESFLTSSPLVSRHRSQESESLSALRYDVLDVMVPRQSTIKHNTKKFRSGSYLNFLTKY